jgi:DNA repair protein RecO (recombination protein O)
MLQKIEGLVLRTTDYGESNKIVVIFTRENGKIGAMARGAKKPNSRLASVSQPLTYGHFLVMLGSGLGSLQQGEIIHPLKSLKQDIFLTAYASYLVELTDKATEERKRNPYLFELLIQTLTYMDEGLDPQVLTNIYEMKLLNSFGLYPILDGCAICKETEGTFAFSIKEGGFICHRCIHNDPHHLKISPAVARLLRLFYHIDIHRLGSINVKDETKREIKKVIDAYYEEYSGLQLKTKKFLTQLEKLHFPQND